MQKNILWKAQEYPSLENCVITTSEKGFTIQSVIIGVEGNQIFKVEYLIKTDEHWHTMFFDIRARLANTVQNFCFQSDGNGHWTTNGKPAVEFIGCFDIDLPLTPFTNSLPINRLKLKEQEQQQIKVIYLDLLDQQIRPLSQHYTRLSQSRYKYQNVPNDFEAVISVDESGFVIDYPGLFEMVKGIDSEYP